MREGERESNRIVTLLQIHCSEKRNWRKDGACYANDINIFMCTIYFL